jgi:hypothetical protein
MILLVVFGFLGFLITSVLFWKRIAVLVVEGWANARLTGDLKIVNLDFDGEYFLMDELVVFDPEGNTVLDWKKVKTKVDFDFFAGRMRLRNTRVQEGTLAVVSCSDQLTLDQALRVALPVPMPALDIEDLMMSNVKLTIRLETAVFEVPNLQARIYARTDDRGYLNIHLRYAKGTLEVRESGPAIDFQFFGSIGGGADERVTLYGECQILGKPLKMTVRYIPGRESPVVLTLRPDQVLQAVITNFIAGYSKDKIPEIEVTGA